MKINFIVSSDNYYKNILYSMIDPIKIHLNNNNYIISEESQNNCINMHFFNEYTYLQKVKWNSINIFMSHGIADKNYRNINRVGIFDYIIVSGELWKDKLVNQGMNENKIFIGGYPKLDLIWSEYTNKQNIINNENNLNNKKLILWCPTHNMNPNSKYGRLSTYPYFNEYIKYIPKKYEFKISEHPANKKNNNPKPTIYELLDSDIIISDSGSLVYEALTLNKPVLFPDWIIKDAILKYYPNTFEEYIFKENIGYHSNTIYELIQQIELVLKNGLNSKTIDFIGGIFPIGLRGNSGKVIAEFLMNLI